MMERSLQGSSPGACSKQAGLFWQPLLSTRERFWVRSLQEAQARIVVQVGRSCRCSDQAAQ